MIKKIKEYSLEFIVFIGGSVIMTLELIGSRLLAPYLGTSIFVWSSLIGIILGALSLGYFLGGRFSKENPKLSFLTFILFLAGLLILLITLIKDPVLAFSMGLGVKSGSIVATFALFTIPSIVLGMVSPYVIRLKIKNVAGSGTVAGNLYALSTIGSIFGTFLTGFYLIPTFGSTQILFGLSLVLILTSLISGKKLIKFCFLIILILLWSFSLDSSDKFIFETDSSYNHIRVVDAKYGPADEDIRIMYLGTETHSIIYKDRNDQFSKYHKLYLLDNLFKPDISKALTLGGGAYITPINFLKR